MIMNNIKSKIIKYDNESMIMNKIKSKIIRYDND